MSGTGMIIIYTPVRKACRVIVFRFALTNAASYPAEGIGVTLGDVGVR